MNLSWKSVVAALLWRMDLCTLVRVRVLVLLAAALCCRAAGVLVLLR
jgi:hypothetical protein